MTPPARKQGTWGRAVQSKASVCPICALVCAEGAEHGWHITAGSLADRMQDQDGLWGVKLGLATLGRKPLAPLLARPSRCLSSQARRQLCRVYLVGGDTSNYKP